MSMIGMGEGTLLMGVCPDRPPLFPEKAVGISARTCKS